MATTVTMPQLGETVVEGTILKWLKEEGERVELDEPLFEISTDKVDTEVPSPAAGVVTKILVQEGETVSVGTELAQIDGGDGGGAAPGADMPVEETPAPQRPAEAPTAPAAPPPPAREQRVPLAAPTGGGPGSSTLSPLVRRLAKEHNVDLSQIGGTGTGGRVTKSDVLAYVAGRGYPAAAPAAPAPPPQLYPPLSPRRLSPRQRRPAPARKSSPSRTSARPSRRT